MDKNILAISPWDISFLATLLVIGSLTHFVYQWLGKPLLAGLIFPTNESTFQHLKLLFTPASVFFTLQFFTTETYNMGFMLSRLVAMIFGMLAICSFFYTYTGIIGDNYLLLDILAFVVGVVATLIFYRMFDSSAMFDFTYSNAIGLVGIIILFIAFALFSVYPPKIPLFFDPATSSYAPIR